jgi:hypothetical protein
MNNRDNNHDVTEPPADVTETRNDVADNDSDVEPLDMLVRWARDEMLAAANMTIAPPRSLERQLAEMREADVSN